MRGASWSIDDLPARFHPHLTNAILFFCCPARSHPHLTNAILFVVVPFPIRTSPTQYCFVVVPCVQFQLAAAKGRMSTVFDKNKVTKQDDGYEWNVQKDFGDAEEDSGWD